MLLLGSSEFRSDLEKAVILVEEHNVSPTDAMTILGIPKTTLRRGRKVLGKIIQLAVLEDHVFFMTTKMKILWHKVDGKEFRISI